MKALKKIFKKIQNSIMCQDSADSAQNYKCDVQHGDIIITATDGMFDNLF